MRAPGGIAYLGNRETTIDVRGDLQTPQSVANLLLAGSTSVLLGATSPSGSVNQKYTNTSGPTNQALSLANGAAAQASTAPAASGAAAVRSRRDVECGRRRGCRGSSGRDERRARRDAGCHRVAGDAAAVAGDPDDRTGVDDEHRLAERRGQRWRPGRRPR